MLYQASPPGYVVFLTLNGVGNGEHGKQVSSGIPKTAWLQKKVASKNIHKNTRLIYLVLNWIQKRFVGKGFA